MKIIIIFFFLLSFNLTFGQELITLFNNELTERIKFESHTKKTVNDELELAVKIHPELLYYYITYQNANYGGKTEPAFQIRHDDVGLLRGGYIKKQTEWFNKGKAYIQTRNIAPSLQGNYEEYFSKFNLFRDFQVNGTCDTCINTDRNIQNYLIVKYYSSNPEMKYNSNEDYSIIRQEIEKRICNNHSENYEKLKKGDLSEDKAKNIFSDIIKYWYLYDGNTEKNGFAAEFSMLLFNKQSEIRESRFRHLRIMAGYSTASLNSYKYRLDYPEKNFFKEYSFDISWPQLYFGLDYSIYLTKKNAPLSKITLEAGYSSGEINQTFNFTLPSVLPPFNGAQEQHLIAKMPSDKNNLRFGKINSFTFKASMPILFIGNNLNLGAGGLVSHTSINFNSKVDFYFQIIERGVRIGGGTWTTVKASGYIKDPEKAEKYTYTQFAPLLFINYQLPFHFSAKAEFSVNYYMLGISYGVF